MVQVMKTFASIIGPLPALNLWSGGGVFAALAVLWWGLLLLRRIRDRYDRILVGLIGVVASYQGLQLAIESHVVTADQFTGLISNRGSAFCDAWARRRSYTS